MISKHLALEKLVIIRLKHDGFINIHHHTEYGINTVISEHDFETECKTKLIGEIDVYATKGKYCFLFEVKSNGITKLCNKAIDQLQRAEGYLFKDYKVFKIWAYCPSKEYLNVNYKWIH